MKMMPTIVSAMHEPASNQLKRVYQGRSTSAGSRH